MNKDIRFISSKNSLRIFHGATVIGASLKVVLKENIGIFQVQSRQQKNNNECLPYLPNPSARAGHDTKSIFKRSLSGLNSEYSFS